MNKLKAFLTRNEQIKGLYITPDGSSWNTTPSKGLVYKTREEILEGSEVVASESSNNEEKEVKQKRKKK